jgi:hypothetical protein
MVNMKASAHQGVHKRALAAQGGDDVQAEVTKAEKLKLRPDAECVNANGVALRVLAREKAVTKDGVTIGERNAYVKAALVSPETLAVLAKAADRDARDDGKPLLLCRPGADFVLSARAAPDVLAIEPGVVMLGEAQRLSLHVCEDESYEWVPFERPDAQSGALAALAIEAQLLTPPSNGQPIEADALKLGRELAKRLFDEVRPPTPGAHACLLFLARCSSSSYFIPFNRTHAPRWQPNPPSPCAVCVCRCVCRVRAGVCLCASPPSAGRDGQ